MRYMAEATMQQQAIISFKIFLGIDRVHVGNNLYALPLSNFQNLVHVFLIALMLKMLLRVWSYNDALARHELEIAKFYAKRKAWVAVKSCSRNVKTISDTKATYEGLFLMQEAWKNGFNRIVNDASKKLMMRIKDKTLHQLKNQTARLKVPAVKYSNNCRKIWILSPKSWIKFK